VPARGTPSGPAASKVIGGLAGLLPSSARYDVACCSCAAGLALRVRFVCGQPPNEAFKRIRFWWPRRRDISASERDATASAGSSISLHPTSYKSGRPDSNRGPRRPERRALPGCATPRRRTQYPTSATLTSDRPPDPDAVRCIPAPRIPAPRTRIKPTDTTVTPLTSPHALPAD
jgi:hypothetical protein